MMVGPLAMAANAMAVTLGMGATIAIGDDRLVSRDMQDLLDHRFAVIAEGELQDLAECTRWTLRVRPKQPEDSCKPAYGSFKRLKSVEGEFVCVSFRGWACYPSQNIN
jgi:hypothetical protein